MVKSVSSKPHYPGFKDQGTTPGLCGPGMLPNLSEPRFPYPQNEIIGHLRGFNEVVPERVFTVYPPMPAVFISNIIYGHPFSGAPCYRLGEQTWSPTLGHPQFDEEARECPGPAPFHTVITDPVWL